MLVPELVVEFARKSSSPLHSCFTWDDGVAADQYRLWQARQLIRVSVQIVPGTDINERVWVSLKPDREDGGGYRSMIRVLNNKDLRAQLLQDAMEDMEMFESKYQRLKELSAVFAAMKQVRRRKAA